MGIDKKAIKDFNEKKFMDEVKGILIEIRNILKEILQELNNLSFV